MNTDQQDFEALRRLLKLKRHEKPPPRYFNDFSARVIQRIQAGAPEERDGFLGQLVRNSRWLQQMLSLFQSKPMLTGAFGAAACALLVGGAIYSEQSYSSTAPSELGGVLSQVGMAQAAPLFGNDSVMAASSTNPATSLTGASIFDGITVNAQPVAFRPGRTE